MFTSTDQLRLIETACDPMIGFDAPYDRHLQAHELQQVLQLWSLVDTFEEYGQHQDALAAGLPSPVSSAPKLCAEFQPMWSAATWMARHPFHPLVPAFEDLLGAPYAFLLLGKQVLQRSADRNYVRLPGISGDLYVLREVSSDLTDPGLSSSGLLSAVVEPSPVTGLDQIRIVLWSMSDEEVDALLQSLP